ncbi:MAG: sensor histidine kinase [Bacteroidota bacterium]
MSDSRNEDAIKYADSAIVISTNAGIYSEIPTSYNNKAVALNNLGRFQQAIESLLTGLDLKDSIKQETTRKIFHQNTLINIGKNYLDMKNYDPAIKYFSDALKAFDQNKRSLAIVYLNLSASFLGKEELAEAFSNAEVSDSIAKVINNLPIQINAMINIASVYEKQSRYREGLEVSNEVLKLSKDINFVPGVALGLGIRGNILGKMKRYQESITDFQESIQLGKTYQDFDYLISAYESISEVYARSNDFDNAYKYYNLYDQLSDSINSNKAQKDFNEILTKYETAEKEKQIIQQDLDLKNQEATISSQRNRNVLLIGGIVVLILGGIIFYLRNKSIQRQELQRAILLEKEKGFESVINATEQERNRISKDLHDGIGQQLSALKMALMNTAKGLSSESEKSKLEEIAESFSKSADEVRQISHQMMPRALMDDGLVRAVEDLLQSSFRFADIQYEFEHHQVNQRFDKKLEISLYRIVQELINNIIKHSQAKNVSVQLLNVKENLILFIEDDGVGMSVKSNDSGQGLLNIKSRLDMVKGSINYEPGENSGTSVSIKIPYQLL